MKRHSLALPLAFAAVQMSAASTPAHAASPTNPGQAVSLTASSIHFNYLSFDGDTTIRCTHEIASPESGDWNVSCDDATRSFKRSYRVHLALRAYTHPTPPRMSYEMLYWITDRTKPEAPTGHSSTLWFHLEDPSALSALEFRQGVDSDSAYLEIAIDLSRR